MENFLRKYGKTVAILVLIAALAGVLALGVLKDRSQDFPSDTTDETVESLFADQQESTADPQTETTPSEVETESETEAVTTAEITTETAASVAELPEFKLKKTEKRDGKIVISTSYCSLSYSDVFPSELEIEAKTVGEASYLTFFASISGKKLSVYTLEFNTAGGISVGTLMLQGNAVRVSVNFNDAPASVTGDDLILFRAYSESFGEIAASLNENQGFKAG